MGAFWSQKKVTNDSNPIYVKPIVPELKFDNYTLTSHELLLGIQVQQQRIYLIFDPKTQTTINNNNNDYAKKQDDDEYNGCVFLLHGTNELCWDTELIEQLQPNQPKYTWMDLAMKHNLLLIYPQSQVETTLNDKCLFEFRKKDKLKAVWAPIKDDKTFIKQLKTKILNQYKIKNNKTYAIGYSNGGIFLLNLLKNDPYLFSVSCSWGGGLEMSSLEQSKISINDLSNALKKELSSKDKETDDFYIGKWSFYFTRIPKTCTDNTDNDDVKSNINKKKSKIVIMTGTMDDNRTPSYRAFMLFKHFSKKNEYEIRFQDWKNSKHQYRADATQHIWECFQNFYEFRNIDATNIFPIPLS